jgi:hypothetical protein
MSGMNNVGGMERLGRMGATRATNTYMHGGRFYAVPPTFQFPKVNLRQGTRLWFKGMTTSVDGGDRILPFRKLDLKMLPKELKNGFKLAWLPIFKYLEEFETEIPKHGSEITDKMIEEYYNDCVDYLKERVSYCFEKGDAMNWTLSTWSKKVQRSYIEKHGNQSDKEHLKEATPSNKERGFKRGGNVLVRIGRQVSTHRDKRGGWRRRTQGILLVIQEEEDDDRLDEMQEGQMQT